MVFVYLLNKANHDYEFMSNLNVQDILAPKFQLFNFNESKICENEGRLKKTCCKIQFVLSHSILNFHSSCDIQIKIFVENT